MGFSSRRIYFPNIIKAGWKFPCRGAAFELSPALKRRAKFTWSLRDREDGCRIYFSKTINPRLNTVAANAAKRIKLMC